MQSEIFQAFVIILMIIGLQLMKPPISKSQKIRILHKKKRDCKYRNVGPLKSIIMHMYSAGVIPGFNKWGDQEN